MESQGQEQLSEKAKAALAARDRLYRRYRKTKEAELRELYHEPAYGPQLMEFVRNITSFTSVDDSESFLYYIGRIAKEPWMKAAPRSVQFVAMSLAAHQIVEIRVRAGLTPFDDPLPDNDDDVFQIVKRTLEPH